MLKYYKICVLISSDLWAFALNPHISALKYIAKGWAGKISRFIGHMSNADYNIAYYSYTFMQGIHCIEIVLYLLSELSRVDGYFMSCLNCYYLNYVNVYCLSCLKCLLSELF